MTHNIQPNALDNVKPATLGQPHDAHVRHMHGDSVAKRGSGHQDSEGNHRDDQHTPGHGNQHGKTSHDQHGKPHLHD